MQRRDLQLLLQIPLDLCLPAGTDEITLLFRFMKRCMFSPISFLSKSVRSSLGILPISAQKRWKVGRISDRVLRP